MPIPNYQHVIAALAQQHPEAWRNAHTNNAHTEDFIRIAADHLHRFVDASIGLNGKRGNADDISDDALAIFHAEGTVVDRTGQRMEVIDCIIGAGGPNPSPGWAAVSGPSPGAWVKPPIWKTPTDPIKPPDPPKPALKAREVFAREFTAVNDFYRSPQGLQRPGGMVLEGSADLLAMIQWGYDLMAGQSSDQVIATIKTSEEYKRKQGV